MSNAIQTYIDEVIRQYKTGAAGEHAYRPALANLLESIAQNITATNETTLSGLGIIDFSIRRKDVILGYVEAKDIGINRLDHLDDREKKQFEKYLPLGNLCYTDYLEFRFYMDNNPKPYQTIRIADFDGQTITPRLDQFRILESALENFYQNSAATIKSSKTLAEIMAGKARMIADIVETALMDNASPGSTLHELLEAFKKLLIKDTDERKFADFFAQTITYGMFVARLNDKTTENFTRAEAATLIPRTMPFLRRMFDYVAGNEIDQSIVVIVDNLADAFAHTNITDIMKNFGRATQTTDPILHFYETFLTKFDPKTRRAMGVFYTPQPVVDYIIRAVDSILKTDFGLPDGLADKSKMEIKSEVQGAGKIKQSVHKVQILDPATGTGTFLAQVIRHIAESKAKNAGMWGNYVENDLLPRVHGFEILMASYAMAHLKLDLVLRETGYVQTDAPINEKMARRDNLLDNYGERVAQAKVQNSENRIGIYLTNSLEEADPDTPNLFGAQWLTAEAREANRIKKDLPIMCVIGNPPYSGISQNNGEWIKNLLEPYKKEPDGQKLQERKHWLNDDYVKFMRLAENFIERNKTGIVGFINNNGFLDNPTFRGMRWNLLNTFDDIYIVNLHGSANKKETAPNGDDDKNVFDIQVGVSLNIFVKSGKKKKGALAKVYYCDLFGVRQSKYDWLDKHNLENTKWEKIKLCNPYYFFVPKDTNAQTEYDKGFSVNDLFPLSSTGIVSARDSLVIDIDKNVLLKRMGDFFDATKTDDQIRNKFFQNKKIGKYMSGDSRGWKLTDARKKLVNADHNKFIKEIAYRPFDKNFIYYSPNMVDWGREQVMSQIIEQDNLVLNLTRQNKAFPEWHHIFICNELFDSCLVSMQTGETSYGFPLYTYSGLEGKQPNLNQNIVAEIEKITSKTTPEQIFNYIYAVLHLPAYRNKYREFLKIDFPRIPYPTDKKEFMNLSTIGEKLVNLHLMREFPKSAVSFPKQGADEIVKPYFQSTNPPTNDIGRVYINDSQYFDNVPSIAWEFFIGGYQPAQKYLKDRRGRKLTSEECEHYENIIAVLLETDRLMKEIDKA
ncbi:MAG: N-6 DNA methylase [Rickettsiales bacterium]|jgi:predicted helicase|nr:N-6 DNA methylase [Rickettsiales bacterium]